METYQAPISEQRKENLSLSPSPSLSISLSHTHSLQYLQTLENFASINTFKNMFHSLWISYIPIHVLLLQISVFQKKYYFNWISSARKIISSRNLIILTANKGNIESRVQEITQNTTQTCFLHIETISMPTKTRQTW